MTRSALVFGAALALGVGASAAERPSASTAQRTCLQHALGQTRAARLLAGARPSTREQAVLRRCGIVGSTQSGAPAVTPGAGSGLVDAGVWGVVRAHSATGGPASPMDCTDSDGNQGFRTQETFAVDPNDPRHLYIAVEFQGFFVSTDGGATWKRSSRGLIGYPRTDDPTKPCQTEMATLAVDPNDFRHLLLSKAGEPGTIADPISENNGIYESTDGGGSWRQILTQSGLGVYVKNGLAFAPGRSSTIYAGTTTIPRMLNGSGRVYPKVGVVYRTRDDGKTWEEQPTGLAPDLAVMALFVKPDDPNTVVAVTLGRMTGAGAPVFSGGLGVIETTDGGAHWQRLDSLGDQALGASVSLAGGAFDHLVAATYGGRALYSRDTGLTLLPSSFPSTPVIVRLDPADPAGLRGLGGDNLGGIFATRDGGASYVPAGQLPQQGTLMPRITWFAWGGDGAWFAAGHYTGKLNGRPSQEPFVFRSPDGGVTWTRILGPSSLPG